MQEFGIKAKSAIRKIAALTTGAVLVGTTVFGAAAAADLNTYPAPFVQDGQWVGLVVVGADAQPADIVGAIDVATTLAGGTGTASETTVTGGVTEDIALDGDLATAFGATLDDNDLPALQDTQLDIYDETIDIHEELNLNGGPFIVTSSTGDKDYADNPVIEITNSEIDYQYVFDEILDWDTGDTEVTDDEPLEIEFLGGTVSITDVDTAAADTITAQVGQEIYFNIDDTATVAGKEVKLLNVGEGGTILLSVEGVTATVTDTATKKVNGLRISVKDTFYTDTKSERAANIVVGEDAYKTYTDGDEYIIPCATPMTEDCDEDSPDWEWIIEMDAVADDTLGVNFVGNWNDAEDPVLMEGDRMYLPNDFAYVEFSGLTVDEFTDYKIYWDDGVDLSDAFAGVTSADVFYIKSTMDDGIVIATEETSEIALYFDGASDEVWVAYKDDDNNWADSLEVADDGVSSATFEFQYGDTLLEAEIDVEANTLPTAANNYALYIDVVNDGDPADGTDDLEISLGDDGASFYGFGTDAEQADPEDAVYDAALNLGDRTESTLFNYGVILVEPENGFEGDSLTLSVPNDVQEATVVIGTKDTVVSGGSAGSSSVSTSGVPVAKLDTEITDKTAYNMILVGGAAVNRLTAEVAGATYPTYGEANTALFGFGAGEATIKLYENAFGGEKVAMVVAGWDAADTRNAANVLKDYSSYSAELTGMQVVVKSVGGIVSISQPSVAAPVVVEETNATA